MAKTKRSHEVNCGTRWVGASFRCVAWIGAMSLPPKHSLALTMQEGNEPNYGLTPLISTTGGGKPPMKASIHPRPAKPKSKARALAGR